MIQIYLEDDNYWGDTLLMTATQMTVTEDPDNKKLGPFVISPWEYKVTVSEFWLNQDYVLLDLRRQKERQTKYRRCGFSKRRKVNDGENRLYQRKY